MIDINRPCQDLGLAVWHLRVIRISTSPKFIELCIKMLCWCPSEGHWYAYGGHTITETSVMSFAMEANTLKVINSSHARTVQLARTWAITPLLTHMRALSGCHFKYYYNNVMLCNDKLGNSNILYNKMKSNLVELKCCKLLNS